MEHSKSNSTENVTLGKATVSNMHISYNEYDQLWCGISLNASLNLSEQTISNN